MRLIDTHTHLYLDDFKNDFEEVRERAKQAGVEKFYLPSIDSSAIDDMLKLEEKYPAEFFPMIGLHPGSVKEDFKKELEVVETYLAKRQFAAMGEIGLDFYWDITFKQQQLEAFSTQMELALQHKLPIVIHTRNAMRETIDLVKPFAARGLRGIFHCFGDSYETAKEIAGMGFCLGIGGVLTYKKANLGEAIKEIPLEFIVLETDAPYLTPVPFRGKRNESSYLIYIAQELAKVKGMSVEEIGEVTSNNAERVFQQLTTDK